MITGELAEPPEVSTLDELNRVMAARPPSVTGGNRAVLGEGPANAPLALVGEQPGDREDIEGRPFVGPAGQLLDLALSAAGLERRRVYVTNAVKHFKYQQRGKRRLHQSPTAGEVKHYRWWLTRELELAAPKTIVALGATAALALAGKRIPVLSSRGPTTLLGWPGYITIHPSAILRIREAEERDRAFRAFAEDLRRAAALRA